MAGVAFSARWENLGRRGSICKVDSEIIFVAGAVFGELGRRFSFKRVSFLLS